MIEIKVKGIKKVKNNLNAIEQRSKNLKLAMGVVGAKAWKDVNNSFDIEKDEDGKRWKKRLEPKKKKGIRKRVSTRPTKRGGNKLLQDTGLLRESIRWKHGSDWARVFTKTKYAGVHQYGAPSKNIVKRSYMWVSEKVQKGFSKIIGRYIVDGR